MLILAFDVQKAKLQNLKVLRVGGSTWKLHILVVVAETSNLGTLSSSSIIKKKKKTFLR